jgi:hypothetical protein
MSRTTAKRHERTYSYYDCWKSVKHGRSACPGTRIAAGKLEAFVVQQVRITARDPAILDAAIDADRVERESERAKLAADIVELRAARGRHAGEQQRLLRAVGADDAPTRLLVRVRELDALVASADARIAKAERDVAALDAPSNTEALRETLVEFDQVWNALDADERARVLGLVLTEVVVNGETGEAELRLRGGL